MDRTAVSADGRWWRPAVPAGAVPAAGAVRADGPADAPLAYAGLLAFTFVLLISPQSYVPALTPLRLALVSAAIAVGGWLAARVLGGGSITVRTREIWLATALLAWTVATVPASLWPGGSVAMLAGLYVKSLVIFWLLANVINTPARLERLAWALTLMSIPLAVTGVTNYASGEFIPGRRDERVIGYDAPLTGNPNDLALMLNMLLPLAVALLLTRPRPALRALLMAVIALDVVAVVLTFSRAGFITLAVVGVCFAWKLRRGPERRLLWVAMALAVISLPFLPAGYAGRLMTVTDAESDPTGSAQARRDDTYAAMRWVARNPVVGAGLGQDQLALNEERGVLWRPVHNVYLQYAVDLGLPGAALFAWLLALCLRGAGAAERRAGREPLGRLAGGVQVSLIAFAVAALFHPSAYHFYFYYFAGLAVAARVVTEGRHGRVRA